MLNLYHRDVAEKLGKPIIMDADRAYTACLDAKDSFSDKISMKIMHDIDGVDRRSGRLIVTKFGETTYEKLSTGCKAAIMAVNYPGIIMSNIEMGDNVIKELFLLSDSCDMSIVMDNLIFMLSVCNTRVTLDGVEMSSREAMRKLNDEFYELDKKYNS
jgi:hypothetical protein